MLGMGQVERLRCLQAVMAGASGFLAVLFIAGQDRWMLATAIFATCLAGVLGLAKQASP